MKDGPNDRVNDSDSRLPSKSSIHSSVTGDKNVDFLALDTTPRVIDGDPFTVTKYSGRVETEEIMKDLMTSRYGLFYKKWPEQVSTVGGTSEIIRCRDYQKERSSVYINGRYLIL